MLRQLGSFGGFAVCLLLVGCYNNPVTSLKKPGEGPVRISGGPAVGPGTTAGGSTAGPQPARVHDTSEVQPQPGGGTPAEPGLGHAQAPAPVHGAAGEVSKTPAQSGNEHGTEGQGPAAAQKH